MLCGCQITLPNATESKSFEGTRWSHLASCAVLSEYKQMAHVSLLHPSFSDGCHMDGRGSTRKIDIIPLLYKRSLLVIAFVGLWVSWFVISPIPWFRGWHMTCFWSNPRNSLVQTKFCCYLRSFWRGRKQNAIAAVNFTSLFSLKKLMLASEHVKKKVLGQMMSLFPRETAWNLDVSWCALNL